MTREFFASKAVIRPSWRGYTNLKHLIILGDSYCAVGYDHTSPHPTPSNPLGVEFPGFTYAEPGEPNWVGHLITEYSPNPNLLVYNYAEGGSRVRDVEYQAERHFLPSVGQKPEWAPWSAADTLFITHIGINDSAYTAEHSQNMESLLKTQETLYGAGARNFLFINVPPMHRCPVAPNPRNYINWNTDLDKFAQSFSATHPDATVMIFSSWRTFNRVMDDPTFFGFAPEDVQKRAGAIWVDHLHPTSKMHDIIARDLGDFLVAQPSFNQGQG